ncbi:MAG: hypothetical protein PHY09_10185 [Desulfuromonadaceae bacterium]|nr:hypothetical protein [Desulfuromonadaceae bacterium]MDD5104814.1 hypothetical protein [Desulfuromonadaceae bacterium]
MNTSQFWVIVNAILFASFTLSGSVCAAPSILSLSRPPLSNQDIVISGNNFGTKPSAEPLVFDNLESDLMGVPPSGWTRLSGNPVVSNTKAYGGSKALDSTNINKGSYNQMIRDLGANSISDKMYLSANIFIEKNDTNRGYQWKVWRWSSHPNVYYANNYPDVQTNVSSVHINAFWTSSTTAYYDPPTKLGWYNSGSNVYSKSGATGFDHSFAPGNRNMYGDQNTWFRFEQVIKLSSAPDVADGQILSYCNGVLTTTWNNLITHSVGDDKWRYFMITNGLESLNDSNNLPTTLGNMKFYFDNVYIDNTFARVELCDTSTWGAKTHCEIQPPTAWGSGQITITFNSGNFTPGQIAYLYVVDSNGAVNSDGYKYKIGAPLPPSPPSR